MLGFLDAAKELLDSGRTREAGNAFRQVFEARAALGGTHSKSNLDFRNLESVFTAFEIARTIGGFANYTGAQAQELTIAMKSLIVTTLEETLKFRSAVRTVVPPEPYPAFIRLIQDLAERSPDSSGAAIISFNYDLAVDFGLLNADLSIDYGLGREPPGGVPLLKLHGSLNWVKCSKCGLVACPLAKYFERFPPHASVGGEQTTHGGISRSHKLELASLRSSYQHCPDGHTSPEPVIVPPTWNKGEYHQELASVWGRAARELKEAERLFVIGYSCPPSDVFFQYLYALGSVGDVVLKHFVVINPDRSVAGRFEDMLGPGAKSQFDYWEKTFGQAIGDMRKELVPA